MKISKKQQVIDLVKEGKYTKAMSIAKSFTREFSKDQLRSIQIAYESQQIKKRIFYSSLEIDIDFHINEAKKLLLNYAK